MRVSLIILLAAVITLAACDKNNVSKIPHISLTTFGPDSVYLSAGTHDSIAYMEFSFVDGDGDIGVDSSKSAIFIKDSIVTARRPTLQGSSLRTVLNALLGLRRLVFVVNLFARPWHGGSKHLVLKTRYGAEPNSWHSGKHSVEVDWQ